MTATVQSTAARLASQVVPADRLNSFLALDLRAQLTGIATLAHIAGDTDVRDAALDALRSL